ncbi:DUF2304 domain-containing protein [Microbacterium sp. W1N]|uniref:DUF2304 domain-containing protein n=1 Tax=Microbacterium festucae TaxID=2977531 RepID=UPI0021C25454|nr:DUF2304 domain-containing protein [Microbacterium festucae]MCT9818771.1 DUF2304 domain-containing protein [Microbacterium festucae]
MIILAGIIFAVVVLAIIITLLLKRQLGEKYATLWLVIGLALLIISIFPGLLLELTSLLGVEVPANLIFALSIVLLVGVALHLSWELSRAEDEIRRVAEETAILRSQVEMLMRRDAARDPAPSTHEPTLQSDASGEPDGSDGGKIQ